MNDKYVMTFYSRKSVDSCIPNYCIVHAAKHDWGYSICIMFQNGAGFARIYWYEDDDENVYLDMLSVHPEARKFGFGTLLQKIRENIGRALGADSAWLWVKKDTWMHQWYKRRGYQDVKDHEEEENAVWMSKKLKESAS